jgi:hypothetical protein
LLGAIVGGAGTVTAIATPTADQSDRGIQLTSRMTVATTYYVRGIIQGNTVKADIFTSAPSTSTVGGSPANTTGTITLSAADTAQFGDSRQGFFGTVFVAIDNTSRLVTTTNVRLHVIRGVIQKLSLPVKTKVDWKNISGLFAGIDNTMLRIPYLSVEGCDFSRIPTAANMTELDTFDATQKQGIRVRDSKFANIPAAAGITPGASPYTYTNSDGYDEVVTVAGGTVSDVSVSKDGGATFVQIATATGTTTPLRPGEQLKVTYSSAPTIKKIPTV